MKERIKRSLISIAGPNTRVIENPKSVEKKKKNTFISIVDSLKDLNIRANNMHEEYGINLFYYEDAHYQIMEELLIQLYGYEVAKVIFWWVYDVDNPKIKDHKIKDEKTGKEHLIRTTTQLYNMVKKLKLFKKEKN
jgi:hypothetical protein